jgi:uncharacterized protein with HEPN domain
LPRKDDRILIYDIEQAIGRILDYTRGGRAEFLSAPIIQDAVIRNLEIVGEAGAQMSGEMKARMPQVPWRRVVDFRNFLIHSYGSVDPEIVWGVVADDLPILRESIERLARSNE